jgi:restriction endonuclease S subunit
LDEIYKNLNTGKPETILQYLVRLDPASALEADIVREYVGNNDDSRVDGHKEICTIREILKSGAKYPMVKLKDYLILNKKKIKPAKNPDMKYKVLGVSNETGVFLNEKLHSEETSQSYYIVAKNEFCYNPYRINVGSIGLNLFDYNNQIISGAYVVFGCNEDELNPRYLEALVNSKRFQDYVNEKASGGVRMNFKYEDMCAWEIPLPSIEEQAAIVAQIEKQKSIIAGAKMLINNWEVDDYLDLSAKEETIDKIAKVDGIIIKDENILSRIEELYVGGENIETGTGCLSEIKSVKEAGIRGPSYVFSKGQVVYSKVRPNLRKCFYSTFEGVCSSDIYPLTVFNENVLPEYFARLLQSNYFANKTQVFQDRAGMPKINRKQLSKISVAIPEKNIQRQILSKIHDEIQILIGLGRMKTEAKNRIDRILEDVWGVEFVDK